MEETNELEINQEEVIVQEEINEEKVIEQPKEVKKEKYFTDEMHKSIFPFQEPFRNGYGAGKAVRGTVKLSSSKK